MLTKYWKMRELIGGLGNLIFQKQCANSSINRKNWTDFTTITGYGRLAITPRR